MRTTTRDRSETVLRVLVLAALAAAWYWAIVGLSPEPRPKVELTPALYLHDQGDGFASDELAIY